MHWNFFFTLGFIPPFVSLFDALFRLVPSYAALAVLLGLAHQVLLSTTGLTDYILNAPRVDLISKNREGIFSVIGYLAVFLTGQHTGMFILPRQSTSSRLSGPLMRRLLLWSFAWTALFILVSDENAGLGMQVSRRLANLPYILWIAAFNTGQITMFYAVECWSFPNIHANSDRKAEAQRTMAASSRLLRAFNRNGLLIFLLANLLTGAVNMLLPTLALSDGEAMGVLLVYMATLSVAAIALDVLNISVKL